MQFGQAFPEVIVALFFIMLLELLWDREETVEVVVEGNGVVERHFLLLHLPGEGLEV